MNKISEWWERRKYRRELEAVRTEIQELWDKANRRRENQPGSFYADAPKLAVRSTPDRWRPIEDYMKKSERDRYDHLCSDEWSLSMLVGTKPEWGHVKHLSRALGEDSPVAYMTVKEDRSTKVNYEYIPEADMIAVITNGKWSSDKYKWKNVEAFKREGWGHPADFDDYLNRWHNAETDEESEAVLAEYRSKYPNAIY